MFTEPPITKRDLFDYYVSVSDRMLPALAGRPISLVRCPSGLSGSCFFQRNPSPGFGDAVKSAKVGKNTIVYIDDLRGLAALVQMNVIEIHAWGAKLEDIAHPDQIVLDLDPGDGVTFKRIAAAAKLLREGLRRQKLESFVRTSGGKGVHVVIPLKPRANWDEVKSFAHGIATSAAREHPEEFVAVAGASKRKDRIFIDYLRNGLAASSVASYSVRAREGVGVATPLSWEELSRVKSAAQFNLRNVGALLRKQKQDPWAGFAKLKQYLPRK